MRLRGQAGPARSSAVATVGGALALSCMLLAACDRGDVKAPGDPSASGTQESAASDDAEHSTPSEQDEGEQGAADAAAPKPKPKPKPSPDAAGECIVDGSENIGVMVTPERPGTDRPLTFVAATFEGEDPLSVRVETTEGAPVEAEYEYRPGVPSASFATVQAPPSGELRLVVGRDGQGLRCRKITVASRAGTRMREASSEHVWPVRRGWDGGEEALFSAWVRELFTAPRGEELAWKRLDQVTSQAQRNFLHDHYGWNEDDPDPSKGLYLKPDCADAPYFFRAYFAWKRQLPFGFRRCSRGRGEAPRCGELRGVIGPPEDSPDTRKPGELGAVQKYFRKTLAWGVHTGNGRTAFGNDNTDFYPLALSRSTLKPGSIYADPYGHIFVVVELMSPQGETPGVLYTVDGQPDGSITRKRFWEGNFLWNPDPALGGSGFKGFRPLDVDRDAGSLVAASDAAIQKRPGYEDVSDEQSKLTSDEFYDRMDALINPGKRDPLLAQAEAVQALYEAAKVRVTSVNNGEDYIGGGGSVSMPDGYAIFETTGAWENYSTPARDLRLLIAIDVVRRFDEKVARNADIYLSAGQSMEELRGTLATARKKLLHDPALSFEYTRSDGSSWKLSLAELVERAEALEMGYNPNDCPEVRWGAPAKSEERKTCKRRAPTAQQRKMAAYRPWFTQRRRPARGDPGPPVD